MLCEPHETTALNYWYQLWSMHNKLSKMSAGVRDTFLGVGVVAPKSESIGKNPPLKVSLSTVDFFPCDFHYL